MATDLTFESLRFKVGVRANTKPNLPSSDDGIITPYGSNTADDIKVASLNTELNNLYTAVYRPTRKFESEAVQMRQMSDALHWLLGSRPNILGVTAVDALGLFSLSAFDLSDILLAQLERSDADMQRLYGANIRALYVYEKLGGFNAVLSADADAQVDKLVLVPAIRKPMSQRDAVVMSATDLAYARTLLADWIRRVPDGYDAYALLSQRLFAQKELVERHAKTPLSRLHATASEAQAILLGCNL